MFVLTTRDVEPQVSCVAAGKTDAVRTHVDLGVGLAIPAASAAWQQVTINSRMASCTTCRLESPFQTSLPAAPMQEEFLLEYGEGYWKNMRKERERYRLNEVHHIVCSPEHA